MARSLHVEQIQGYGVQDFEVEIVERKGKGHPDSLIDGASESVSLGLSKFYLENFGAILHHNVDKGILVGGEASAKFGGGRVLQPIYLLVAGRATAVVPLQRRGGRCPGRQDCQEMEKGLLHANNRVPEPHKPAGDRNDI